MHILSIEKEFIKDLKKKLRQISSLYIKIDTLILADVFENLFWKMCFKIYQLDPVEFLSAPGLAW